MIKSAVGGGAWWCRAGRRESPNLINSFGCGQWAALFRGRLGIVSTSGGGPDDDAGEVEFRAAYRTADGAGLLRERSRFERRAGRWVYVDGDIA